MTLDLPVAGQRHKDLLNGLSVPPRLTIANLIDMAMKPKWYLNMLRIGGESLVTSSVTWMASVT